MMKHNLNEVRLLGSVFVSATVTLLAIVGGFYLAQLTGQYTYGWIDYILMSLIGAMFFFGALPVCYHILHVFDGTRKMVAGCNCG